MTSSATPWPIIAARHVAKLEREGRDDAAYIAFVSAGERATEEADRARDPDAAYRRLRLEFWREYLFRTGERLPAP